MWQTGVLSSTLENEIEEGRKEFIRWFSGVGVLISYDTLGVAAWFVGQKETIQRIGMICGFVVHENHFVLCIA